MEASSTSIQDDKPKDEKPCRVCTDFKSWTRHKRGPKLGGIGVLEENNSSENDTEPIRSDCPLDKDSLGRNTWSFLHTMAGYYPEEPTTRQQKEMTVFVKLFSKIYPCDHCAEDFRKEIKHCPPDTTSRINLSQWFCRMHNIVNRKLGKEEYDCKLVAERWRDGWSSGECD